jgi:hypothetical protein
MKHYFDEILKDGVLALEACKEPELYMAKLWVHLYVIDDDITAELCTDTDLAVEIGESPVFLITFTGAWLHLKPIGGEEDTLQDWYDKWSVDDRFHKVLGCVFTQLRYTGDVEFFELDPPED